MLIADVSPDIIGLTEMKPKTRGIFCKKQSLALVLMNAGLLAEGGKPYY